MPHGFFFSLKGRLVGRIVLPPRYWFEIFLKCGKIRPANPLKIGPFLACFSRVFRAICVFSFFLCAQNGVQHLRTTILEVFVT